FRIQVDLLVGMEPPAARARDRHRLSAAVPLVSVARRFQRRIEAAVMGDLRARRPARGGRLVDGGLGSLRARRSLTLPSRDPSGASAADLRGHRLDTASLGGPAVSRAELETEG